MEFQVKGKVDKEEDGVVRVREGSEKENQGWASLQEGILIGGITPYQLGRRPSRRRSSMGSSALYGA